MTAAGTTLLALAATASANPLAPQAPHSPNAEAAATAYWIMLAVFIVIVVAVNAALVVALLRRKAAAAEAATGSTRVRRRRDNYIPGVAFGALAVAILVMAAITTTAARDVPAGGNEGLAADANHFAQLGMGDLPPYVNAAGEPVDDIDAPGATNQGVDLLEISPVRIKVVGQRWIWRFEYPGNNPQGAPRFTYGELVVPVDTPVVLDVTSVDVAHTWWVPALGGQTQGLPGSHNRTWFKADTVGTFHGASTTFSGAGFPEMRARVRVLPANEYRSFVEKLEKELVAVGDHVQETVSNNPGNGPQAGN